MHDASYESLRRNDAVHLWQGRARDEPDPGELALLSAEERDIALRRPAPVGTWYAHAHAEVRRILAGYCNADPRELRMGRWPCPRCPDPAHGRPRLLFPRTGLDFNLSRSGPYWLLAVAAERPVGVDLEAARALDDIWSTSLVVMSGAELRHLARLPDEASRTAAFYRAWTRKEAVAKASGVGVVADLSSIDVAPHLPGPVTVRHVEPRGPDLWLVRDLPIGHDRYAALAREPESTGPILLIDPGGPRLSVLPLAEPLPTGAGLAPAPHPGG
ncbi:4'-phosphopantetheinyl transferase family protein [Streptomyces sp. NPDC058657]|uniref:4'-phosphopantetheinyl transferase family protein n=1 Tax=unclassified Streptomyces TaxID=2593676 RepID=UPI00364769AE